MNVETSSLKSTTRFYGHMRFAMRAVRTLLRGGQALGPWVGVPLATRIFLTPLPLKWMQKRKAWDAGWRIERSVFENASITLYRYEKEPKPMRAALLVHGWGGHAGQMLPIAKALIARTKASPPTRSSAIPPGPPPAPSPPRALPKQTRPRSSS
jgi:hypothetical protein